MTRKPQHWRGVFRRLPRKSSKPHRGILALNRAAAPRTTRLSQPCPARLPDGAGHRRSQPAANVANGVRRRSSTIPVNRVRAETAVEFGSSDRWLSEALLWSAAMLSQRSSTSLMRSSTVNCCNFVSMTRASFPGTQIGHAAAVRKPPRFSAGFLEFGIRSTPASACLRQ